ncbi:MAG: YceI family protein, partial [Isosphaeraceae bacterium]
MLRSLTRNWIAVLLFMGFGLTIVGCSNPADDKFMVTAEPPKPLDASAPAPTPSAEAAPVATAEPAPAPTPGALAFSPSTSKIEFEGSKVTGSHTGGFKAFSGSADLAADGGTLSRILVEIDMDSTWSDNDRLTGHLKNADFFDVPKFPKSQFVSTEIKPGGVNGASHTVTGNLTLHGVTKSISFPATITVQDGTAALKAEFALNRKDFGIQYAGKTDDLI